MSATLFGQYYTTKSSTKQKYQKYDYTCSTADDGTNNSVVFDDSAVELVDANGNTISKLDLSDIQANPITDYRNGSFTLGAGEVKFIEGIEYGKSYKKMYFKIPDTVITHFEEHWEDHCNVSFNLLYNETLELKEYNLKTGYDYDDEVSIIYKLNQLFIALGLEDKIAVDIETVADSNGVEHTYLTFTSMVLGYDFLIESFQFHNLTYSYYIDTDTEEKIEIELNDVFDVQKDNFPIYGSNSYSLAKGLNYSLKYNTGATTVVTNSEDNVVFSDGDAYKTSKTNFLLGNYDNEDYPNIENSADHFYRSGELDEISTDSSVDSSTDSSVDSSTDSSVDSSIDSSTADSSVDSSTDSSTTPKQTIDEFLNDSSVIEVVDADDIDTEAKVYILIAADGTKIYVIRERYYNIESDRSLEIGAFKYINGAARVWFFVPEIPEGDEQNFSLKINHVKDYVTDYVPIDKDASVITYKKEMVDVYASERSDYERHEIEKPQQTGTRYKDSNGEIVYVTHTCPVNINQEKRHIGMYRYLEYVSEHCDWLNFGQFYGLITNADDATTNVRNLANSVFILNKNEYDVKVNYFIGV